MGALPLREADIDNGVAAGHKRGIIVFFSFIVKNVVKLAPIRPLVLGSTSRYRQELLARLRLPFSTAAPDIDESALENERPDQTALRLAVLKAQAVAARHPDAVVIGSDQVATCDAIRLGKPGNRERAITQLTQVAGRTVTFHTAVCVLDAATGQHEVQNVPTYASFRALTQAQIEAYVDAEQPFDCAGSAKVEALGIALLQRVESTDPTALIGLPLIALTAMLNRRGIAVI